MARRGFVVYEPPEEPERPFGSVRFADPSKAEFSRHVHTFNEPHSPASTGECNGVDTQRRWQYSGEDAWRAMNKKRGCTDEGDP